MMKMRYGVILLFLLFVIVTSEIASSKMEGGWNLLVISESSSLNNIISVFPNCSDFRIWDINSSEYYPLLGDIDLLSDSKIIARCNINQDILIANSPNSSYIKEEYSIHTLSLSEANENILSNNCGLIYQYSGGIYSSSNVLNVNHSYLVGCFPTLDQVSNNMGNNSGDNNDNNLDDKKIKIKSDLDTNAKIDSALKSRLKDKLDNPNKEKKRLLVIMKESSSPSISTSSGEIVGRVSNFEAVDHDLNSVSEIIDLANNPNVKWVMEDPVLYFENKDAVHITNVDYVQQITVDNISVNSNHQTVCVLDTGVNYNHPDLSGYIILGRDTKNEDNDPMDDGSTYHGTHVAGTVHAVASNAKIAAVKVCGTSCSGFDMIQGAQWCLDNKDIYNITTMSISISDYSAWNDSNCPNWMDDILQQTYNAGIFTAVASGNQGNLTGIGYPACSPYVISVGATDKSDAIWIGTNRGDNLDILAPGVGINSTNFVGYKSMTGTSMATPHVAGASVLLREYFEMNGIVATPKTLKSNMTSTGVMIGSWPRLNLKAAFDSIGSYDCVEEWEVRYTPCSGHYNVKYYSDNNSCGSFEYLPADNGSLNYCGPSGCDYRLKSYWTLDNTNAIDIISGINGTATVSGIGSGAYAKVGTSLKFIGTHKIIIPDSSSYDEFSFVLWNKFTSFPAGYNQNIISKQDGTGVGQSWLYLDKTGSLKMVSGIGGSKSISSYAPDSNWHFYALTYRNGVLNIYVDSVNKLSSLVNEQDATGNFVFGTNKNLNTVNHSLVGYLDEVAFFTKELSQNEINSFYLTSNKSQKYCNLSNIIRSIRVYRDLDGDGYGAGTQYNVSYSSIWPAGYANNSEDCNDNNPSKNVEPNGCVDIICGNNLVQVGEQCDDGNNLNNDGCSSDCIIEICGDGIVQSSEECDDGNNQSGDCCDNLCNLVSSIPDGMIHYWDMNNDSFDNVGNSKGKVNSSEYVLGKLGYSLNFDKVNDYFNSYYSPVFNSGESFSVSLWFKANQGDNPLVSILFGSQENSPGVDETIQITDTAGKISMVVSDTDSIDKDFVRSVNSYDDGNWHNVVGVFDSSALQMNLYVDGSLQGTSPITLRSDGLKSFTGSPFYIGALDKWSSQVIAYYFKGSIDEVAVFNRSLTPGEVLSLFNQVTFYNNDYCTEGMADFDGDSLSDDMDSCNNSFAPNGMMNYFAFTEQVGSSVMDSFKSKRGVLNGSSSYVSGIVGDALTFDGDDYVDTNINPLWEDGQGFAISLWFKAAPGANSVSSVLLGSKAVTIKSSLNININGGSCGTGKIGFVLGDFNSTKEESICSLRNYADNNWHNVVAMLNPLSNKMELYLDGNLDSSKEISVNNDGMMDFRSSDFFIGAMDKYGKYSTSFFKGEIDEVAFFNNSLPLNVIREMYNNVRMNNKGYCSAPPLDSDSDGILDSQDSCNNNLAPNGMVSYWGFEDDSIEIVDSFSKITGNANNGSYFVLGKSGNGIYFDGINDYANLNYMPSFGVGDSFTVMFWIKTNETRMDRMILGSKVNSPDADEFIQLSSGSAGCGSGKLGLVIADTDSTTTNKLCGTTIINNNNWHHVALDYDYGLSIIRMYIDGTLAGSVAITSSSNGIKQFNYGAGYPWYLGSFNKWGLYSINNFYGVIDEFAVFNRSLSAGEISSLYAKDNYCS